MTTQQIYEKAIANGCTPAMAEMFALRQPPGTLRTERAFMQGRHNNSQFNDHPDWLAADMMRTAHQAGISTTGKVYCGGLADGRGPADPLAWVSGVDDVKDVCRERNLSCRGAVKHERRATAPGENVRLAEDIVQEEVAKQIAKNPALKLKSKRELREAVIEKHGAKK